MDKLSAEQIEQIESYQRDISASRQKVQYEKHLSFHRLETAQSELDSLRLETTLGSILMKQQLKLQLEKNRSLCGQLERNAGQKTIELDAERMTTCDAEARLERERISFFEMTSKCKNEVERMQTKIHILQAQYSRRPSREEDSLLIVRLEKEVSQKTAVLEKALQDMAYIKRELINREENYNKKFNSSPAVGTLRTGSGFSQLPDSSVPTSGRAAAAGRTPRKKKAVW